MTEIVLPFPPSANRIWRIRRGRKKPYPDPRYQAWRMDAWKHRLTQKCAPIKGKFTAEIIFDETRPNRGDLDNRIKGLMDALQSFGLIENDKFCQSITVAWGDAPEGVRVRLMAA